MVATQKAAWIRGNKSRQIQMAESDFLLCLNHFDDSIYRFGTNIHLFPILEYEKILKGYNTFPITPTLWIRNARIWNEERS